jgi:uncharacterized protein YdeI (YjbR/CyaY-like superfamily)
MNPVRFTSAAEFHTWLEKHHTTGRELLIAFYRKGSRLSGLTYAEALDEALCFGWIDGVRKSFEADSYTIRFTPRKQGSIWSNINVRHVERLTRAARMRPAGLAAFAARSHQRTGIYSFENRPKKFSPAQEKQFRANVRAWAYFSAQPPGYRNQMIWRVVSAKQAATQARRLARLMAESGAGRRMD